MQPVRKNRTYCAVMPQLLKDATESRRKCELMKEQETQLKQQVSKHTVPQWIRNMVTDTVDLPGNTETLYLAFVYISTTERFEIHFSVLSSHLS